MNSVTCSLWSLWATMAGDTALLLLLSASLVQRYIEPGSSRRYNRLYTVTAQCLEPDLPQHESTFQEILASFLPPV